jgi:5-methylcytosine-specific restriction endonuclease McrA
MAMPIKPENRCRYPADWKAISKRIREVRAGNRCEWCGAVNYEPHPITGSKVILTVAHLDHTPENCDEDNLAALCQRCHLRYDAKHHAATARRTRDERSGQGTLPNV